MNRNDCCNLPRALVLLAGLITLGAARAEEAEVPPDEARAQAAIADLGQRLKGALMSKMQSEGPVAAVDFCHVEAPKIAAAVAQEHGLGIGRTALRHRSPGNAPEPWQADVLERFAQQAGGTPPGQLRHVERVDGTLRFARGIATEAPCLTCHGPTIAEPVRAAIAARYPGDQATGFSEGDLRGMFWVEIDPASPSDEALP